MKKYRCYLRTVLLSVLAAFIIDAFVNFDEYQKGWAAALDSENEECSSVNTSNKLPVKIGRVTGMIFTYVLNQ